MRYSDVTVVTHVAMVTTITRTVIDLHATTAMVVAVDEVAVVVAMEGTEGTIQTNTVSFACDIKGNIQHIITGSRYLAQGCM
jgi:hypothetical protein